MNAWWKRLSRRTAVRPKSETSADLVMGLTLIKSALAPPAGVVYYPSCGLDRSVSDVWPSSRVVYVDIAAHAIAALRAARLEAVCADALTFNPGPVDVLLLLNPAIPPNVPSGFVVPGGLVICNDYHHTATQLRRLPSFELLGLVRSDERRQVIFDRDRPELYWEEAQTDEELRRAPFSWGGMSYDDVAQIVELTTGGRDNLVSEYRRILAAARAAQPDSPEDGSLWLEIGGQTRLLSRLPGKKGTADSLFVFRKLAV